MTRRATLGLIAAFLVQAAALGYMVTDRALLLARGTEIRLPVRPVDPRDLVRGEYVTLAYDISRLNARDLAAFDPVPAGGTVYVRIERSGEAWKPVAATRAKPGEGLFLKGKVERLVDTDAERRLEVSYDLEKFFMPEGQAIAVERIRDAKRVEVDVAVGSGGRAALRRLVIDGALRYEDTLF